MMPPEDVLLMMAQLGVAIAGFNGVAAALSQGEPRSLRRGVIGSVLITASASVIAWSVIPLVLLTTAMDPGFVWRGSSAGWALSQIGLLVFRDRQARRLAFAPNPVARVLRILALITSALQLWNAAVWAVAWPHVLAVTTSLVIAITAFFVLSHEDESVAS
ncbi:MAG: hypothetical protein IPK00_04695 [Deltaproteobacteria bacterium]|nr:hypothetical protein [Deltaproteobacteria bacterium]